MLLLLNHTRIAGIIGVSILALIVDIGRSTAQPNPVITVDVSRTIGRLKHLGGVNAGPGNSVAGYRDAGITLVRTHDLYGPTDYHYYFPQFFDTQLDIANPDNYAWESSDARIAAIVENGFQAYIRLGISWPSERRNTPTQPPANPGTINNFSRFAELCRRTVLHYNTGWANGHRYNIRYWEIWNEPDGRFWDGTPQQFYTMYETVARFLKELDPTLQVGGPAITGGSVSNPQRTAYSKEFLRFCREHNVPLDFFSWHCYARSIDFDPWKVRAMALRVRQWLDAEGFTGTESHLNEINIDLGRSRNPDLNSPTGAAFVAATLIALQDSPVDKLMWYRGQGHSMGIIEDDAGSEPRHKWNGLPFKAAARQYQETPIRVLTTGQDTTQTLLALAGKSEHSNRISVLVTNYRNPAKKITVNIGNHSLSAGEIPVTITRIAGPDQRYNTTTKTVPVSEYIQIELENADAPSVHLIELIPSR